MALNRLQFLEALEDSYSAVPVTAPESLWKDKTDYRNMTETLETLREKGLIQ